MKKFIISLFFILLSFLPKAQTATQIHIDHNNVTYNWRSSGQSGYGLGCFYICVTRTTEPDAKGLYWFYFYAWSNSFYSNGLVASTYITNININAVDINGRQIHLVGPYYFLAYPKTTTFNGYNLAGTMYSPDPQQIFNITWGTVTPY